MADLDFMREVEVRKAKTVLKPYRGMREYRTAIRAIVKLAHEAKTDAEVSAATFRAALWFSLEESRQGYEYATNCSIKGKTVHRLTKADYRRF
jgi:hypothetical protein